MAKNPRKSSGKTLSRSRGRNFAGDQASSRGTRKRAILPVGEAAAWERRRHDMADRDLVFRENFPPLPRKRERGRGGQKKKTQTDEKSGWLFSNSPMYWHSLNITRGRNLGGKTTRPLLSVHYPSVMGPFYTMAVPRYALAIDQFLREDNAGAHGNGARPRSQRSQTRRRTRRFAVCASTARRRRGDEGERPRSVARASRAPATRPRFLGRDCDAGRNTGTVASPRKRAEQMLQIADGESEKDLLLA